MELAGVASLKTTPAVEIVSLTKLKKAKQMTRRLTPAQRLAKIEGDRQRRREHKMEFKRLQRSERELQALVVTLSTEEDEWNITLDRIHENIGETRQNIQKIHQNILKMDGIIQNLTLSSLELPWVVSIASGPLTPVSAGESTSHQNEKMTDLSASIPQYRQKQKSHDPARDISIQVLEKFSLVTKFARDTTSQLFRETHNNGFGSLEKRNSNHSTLDNSHKPSDFDDDGPVQHPVEPDPLEAANDFDSNGDFSNNIPATEECFLGNNMPSTIEWFWENHMPATNEWFFGNNMPVTEDWFWGNIMPDTEELFGGNNEPASEERFLGNNRPSTEGPSS